MTARSRTPSRPAASRAAAPSEKPSEPRAASAAGRASTAPPRRSVSGTVTGGGQIGPGGAVVWLKRLDGAMPRIAPPANQVVTQREKTFLPHVLAVPLGHHGAIS